MTRNFRDVFKKLQRRIQRPVKYLIKMEFLPKIVDG